MFTKKDKTLDRAISLWNSICAYNGDSATRIQKAYDYKEDEIIKSLATFPRVQLYCGHRKGKKNDGCNPSAMKILRDAIDHLLQPPYLSPPKVRS